MDFRFLLVSLILVFTVAAPAQQRIRMPRMAELTEVLYHRDLAEMDFPHFVTMVTDAGGKIAQTLSPSGENFIGFVLVDRQSEPKLRRAFQNVKGTLVENQSSLGFSTRRLILKLDNQPGKVLSAEGFFQLLIKNQLNFIGYMYGLNGFQVIRQGLEATPTDSEVCEKLKRLPGIADCNPNTWVLMDMR